MIIGSEEKLRELYPQPKGRAVKKQLIQLEKHSINFITHSPFVVLSTVNHQGQLDSSPRGGEKGFVYVQNQSTLIIPNAKGNNRLDSMSNIIETGQIGCLFLIPGIDETLRVNGRAQIISIDEFDNSLFANDNQMKSVIKISITEVFLHCAKALMRSKLWRVEQQIDRSYIPTMGEMINDQIGDASKAESQEDMIQRYLPDL